MKRFFLLFIIITTFVVSCTYENVFTDPKESVALETSQQVLSNSIVYDKAGVLGITEQDKITGKFSKIGENDLAGDYPLTLVAQVDPPYFDGGTNLTASHVHVDGDFAYVSYNTVDVAYVGAIDVINVSDPTNPIVTSRLYFKNADINALKYDNGYVYAVGGMDSEKSILATSNSFVAKIPSSGGQLNVDAGITYGFQQGYVATDVETTANTILVTSGMDGSLTVYDKGNVEVLKEVPFADLRSVAIKDNMVALLDGSKGVSLLDLNFQVTKEIAIDTDFGAAKRTVDFSGDKIIVSEGSKGAGVYNYASGSLIEYIPILINPEGVADEDIVTNAIATNEDVILMSNGGAGLCLSEDKDNATNVFGVVELEGSINYVESKGDYVFAASGKEGLQIIKLNRPTVSLAERCSTLSAYRGSSNLSVGSGEVQEYRGSKRFNKVEIEGSLLLCGSWTVNDDVDINENALFEMNGTFVVGRNNKRKDITVDEGATFRVEGNLTIYGDLVLEDGATLEFIGEESVVNIFGSVEKSNSAVVEGTFKDVKNKF